MSDSITFQIPLHPQPVSEDGAPTLEVGWYNPIVENADGEQEPGPDTYGAWTTDGEQVWPSPFGLAPGVRIRRGGGARPEVEGVQVMRRDADGKWVWVITLQKEKP